DDDGTADSNATISQSSDSYSLGASLYYCMTGVVPFRGHATAILHQVLHSDPVGSRLQNPDIPVDLETICRMAMEKEPERRYASAIDFAADLRRFIAGEAVLARPPSMARQLRSFVRKNRALAAALGGIAALLFVLLTGTTAAALLFRSQSQALAQSIESEEQATANARDATIQSLNAADALLVSVTEDAQLLPQTTGGQEISRRLLLRARAYYQQLLQRDGQQPIGDIDDRALRKEIQYLAARANVGLARVALAMDDHNAVAEHLQSTRQLMPESFATAQAFVGTTKTRTDAAERLILEAVMLGAQSEFLQGNAQAALAQFVEALDLYNNLPVDDAAFDPSSASSEMIEDQLLLSKILRG
ncbi:MAG: hypothetical protein AAFN70_20010, partial [Planctomycetota bacterium]